jgi:hypothetical protein
LHIVTVLLFLDAAASASAVVGVNGSSWHQGNSKLSTSSLTAGAHVDGTIF